MTRLPPLKAREVVRGLRALGFERVRQRDSHIRLQIFTFWIAPTRFFFGGAPISPEEAFFFLPRESVTLEAGSKKEVDYR